MISSAPTTTRFGAKHLHHGYWIRGDESKEVAQLQLTEYLAELANIQTGSAVLDIGCGVWGQQSLPGTEVQGARDGHHNLPVCKWKWPGRRQLLHSWTRGSF